MKSVKSLHRVWFGYLYLWLKYFLTTSHKDFIIASCSIFCLVQQLEDFPCQESYFIRNDGWIIGSLIPLDALRRIFKRFAPWYRRPGPDLVGPSPEDPPKMSRRVFCRLFSEGTQPDAEGLIELGLAIWKQK